MRIYLFIGALLVSFSLSAQNQYAPWDFRNTNLINAQVGIGVNIGNQNSNFYLFTKFDLCPMCLLAKETIEQEWREKGVSNYFTERGFRPNLHIEFLTQKNFRYYGKKFDNRNKCKVLRSFQLDTAKCSPRFQWRNKKNCLEKYIILFHNIP